MSNLAIKSSGLCKLYPIGVPDKYPTLREALMRVPSAALRAVRSRLSREIAGAGSPHIWALRDVEFEVEHGEVLGIIGRNGAGKSTLLKILSGITEPTAGYADIYGRIGSLLEVGTGFHPELTGRENIFMNGALLGMSRNEIKRKFDEIVAFADVEQFLETPVKRYSSGMYVRLAFAVAAHFEPELLMIDEVLAVGDAAFQRKCLGKMHDLTKGEGRTILFVSHNIDAIQRLCSKCLLIEDGRLVANGDTAITVARYLSHRGGKARPNEWIELAQFRRAGSGQARFVAARYSSFNEAVGCYAYANGQLEVCLAIESDDWRTVGSLGVTLYSPAGTKLVNVDTVSLGQSVKLREGRNLIKVRIRKLHLNPGTYFVGFWLADPISASQSGEEYDHIPSAFELEVVENSAAGLGVRPNSDGLVSCSFDVTGIA